MCLNQKGILLGAVPESLVAVIPELLEQRPALQLRLEPMFARRLNSSEWLTALWHTLEDSFSAVPKQASMLARNSYLKLAITCGPFQSQVSQHKS